MTATPGVILILNGASSSGKTTLLKALQKTLDPPFLDAGIDKFIWMLPGRFLDRPLWDDVLGLADRAGPTGHRLFSGMHHSIAALSRAGNCVVADHVLVEPDWVRECAELFAGLPAYLIGVRCPLDVLEQREAGRRGGGGCGSGTAAARIDHRQSTAVRRKQTVPGTATPDCILPPDS